LQIPKEGRHSPPSQHPGDLNTVTEDDVFEAITAWATLVIALGTIASLLIAFRAIRIQSESMAGSVSADLALKLVGGFDKEATVSRRSRVANGFLNKLNLAEAEDLFDFFEQVGLFVRKGLIDAEIAHSFFFHWVNLYWVSGRPLIETKRLASADLWKDFEYLYKRLLEIEMTLDPRSRFINPSDELIRQGLEEELQ
jgi:hypothetical protein